MFNIKIDLFCKYNTLVLVLALVHIKSLILLEYKQHNIYDYSHSTIYSPNTNSRNCVFVCVLFSVQLCYDCETHGNGMSENPYQNE